MPDPIVFAPLVDSPETLGDGLLRLPELQVFGIEEAGGYGFLGLSRVTTSGAGTAYDAGDGTGGVTLPGFYAFGGEANVGITVSYPGYATFFLPGLRTSGAPAVGLVPSSGNALMNLPGLDVVSTGGDSKIASAVVLNLQPLQVFGFEAAGAWGIFSLPGLTTTGVQTFEAPTAFSSLQQNSGYLVFVASPEQYITVNNAGAGALTQAYQDILVVQNALTASFSMGNQLRAHPNITLAGELSDALAMAYSMVVACDATGDVTSEPVRAALMSIADTLSATLAVACPLRSMITVAVAGTLHDILALGVAVDVAVGELVGALDADGVIQRSLEVADAVSARFSSDLNQRANIEAEVAAVLRDSLAIGAPLDVELLGQITQLVEAKLAILLSMTDSASGDVENDNLLRMSLVVVDGGVAALDTTNAVRALFNTDLNGVAYVTLRFGAADYSGWVMNTENAAPSQYQNYPFDGFATFNHKHYGFGPAGTVRFDGTTDAGEQIPAWLRTFFTDFGTGVEKRVSDVYVGATNAGALVVKAVSYHRGTGVKYEDWYSVKTLPGGVAQGRAQIGQGLRSIWWQFELHNVAGSDFELEEITFSPILSDRRV